MPIDPGNNNIPDLQYLGSTLLLMVVPGIPRLGHQVWEIEASAFYLSAHLSIHLMLASENKE